MHIKDQIKAFENKLPHIVFEWHDSETDAVGWVVINSLRGGAAGGGTRMRKGLDKNEVLSLAKTMEIKFAICGPPIGGAKSGINFDPNDPRKEEVLNRWFKAVIPLLKNYYGTGGDLNVDELKDVIPITEKYGLQHPQEGVLVGHFNPTPKEKIQKIDQLQKGVSLDVDNPKYSPNPSSYYTVADLITGFGVSEAAKSFYDIWGKGIVGKKAIIQGWGNVGAAAGFYLAQAGAKIVGIIDKDGGIIQEEGLSFEEVKKLFLEKENNTLQSEKLLSFEEVNAKIWHTAADIFVPAAASRLVSEEQLTAMKNAGVELISCGANVPFRDPEIFMGKTAQYADENFSVIADFIANCGMARTFAYLMQNGINMTDEAIFNDVSQTIKNTLSSVHKLNSGSRKLNETAYQLALENIEKSV